MDEPRPNIAFNVKWLVSSGGPFLPSRRCSRAAPGQQLSVRAGDGVDGSVVFLVVRNSC